MCERRNDLEIVMERANVLRDPTRIDLLFTMSEIPHGGSCSGSRMRSDVSRTNYSWLGSRPVFALASFAGHASINLTAPPRVALGEAWWSQTGSNRRPHACKARALPAELWPRNQKTNASLACRAKVRVNRPAIAGVTARQPSFKMACRARSCRAAKAGGPGKT